MILKQLNLLDLLTIVYTDLYSLYKYLVKHSITKEKYLIVDIIVLQQSYKQKELYKIW
jgi:hypothetical protein